MGTAGCAVEVQGKLQVRNVDLPDKFNINSPKPGGTNSLSGKEYDFVIKKFEAISDRACNQKSA